MGEFLVSVPGMACVLIFKLLVSAILICLAVHLFDFKKWNPFFTLKRVASMFFFLVAIRVFYGALHFF